MSSTSRTTQWSKLRSLLVLFLLVAAFVPASTVEAQGPLRGTTDYAFVGLLGQVDAEGRLLAWEGEITGDITGTIQWWAVDGTPDTGQVHHFIEHWVILGADGSELLSGEDYGTTTIRHLKNTIWRTNGTVTDANDDYQHLIGRNVHAGGEITWQWIDTPDGPVPVPEAGTGTFRIN